ncbi:RHS repeat domain-containing protein [Streptomyces lasalocidi]
MAVTRRYFDPYGNPRGPQPTTWADNHGYLGKPADPTTGLNLLGARNYDPVQGRFLTADPLMEARRPEPDERLLLRRRQPQHRQRPHRPAPGLRRGGRPGLPQTRLSRRNGLLPDHLRGGNGGTTTSSGGTTAAPSAAPTCNVSSKFGGDVCEAQQMADNGPPTSGTLRDFIA